MGVCYTEKKLANSGLFNYDEEKEKIIINSIERINFKDLFMESLTPEFFKLFKENTNLFYSQPFIEGISYEYGMFGKSKDVKKALKIYKEAADFKYDYLCMYRMHRIYLTDYEYFKVKKNGDLHRLYLYKCFAYLPYLIIENTYHLLNKIDVTNEISMINEKYENSNSGVFDEFINFLKLHKYEFNITTNDIILMKWVIYGHFAYNATKNIEIIDNLLNIEKGDNAYYEAQLKYCNFYLKYSGENCDKQKINNIFDNLIKAEYYKASCDYGRFLKDEKNMMKRKLYLKKALIEVNNFVLVNILI